MNCPRQEIALTFLLETMRLGLTNLRLHKLRSILTALGIILGVSAVITMVSVGEGSKQEALNQIERLGAKNIIIRSERPAENAQQQAQQSRSFMMRYGLTREDLAVIQQNFPEVEVIVPLKEVGSQVLREERRVTSQAYGTTPDLQEVAKLRIARGRYLTRSDMDEQVPVAVIGTEVVKQLFPWDDPLGQTIRIDDKAFTIVGVLAPVGLSGGAGGALVGRDLNKDMHIPMTTARAMFGDAIFRRQSGSFQAYEVQVSEIYISCQSREAVMPTAARLGRILNVRHPGLTDVATIVPYELLENAKKQALTWQLVLAFVAGISLLVGGIGIMNIMLASVVERTREIGIRRALGATRKHIIWQFLVETGVLSCVGGLIGIGLGIALSWMIGVSVPQMHRLPLVGGMFSSAMSLPTQITLWSVLLAFGVAAATGLVFGIYPARKAAEQDPIVALRHD
jgi:putative ABC transport system permease protein